MSSGETRIGVPEPYEDEGYCMFYATQDAAMYFKNLPLQVDDRNRIIGHQTRRHELINLQDPDEGLILDAKQVINELERLDIYPKKIYAHPSWQRAFRRFNFIARMNLKFSRGYIHFPAIVFSDGSKESHVWFCPSEERLAELEEIHESPGDKTVFAIEVEHKSGSSE